MALATQLPKTLTSRQGRQDKRVSGAGAMKRMTYTSVVAGAVAVTGALVAGCSGGGGGGGGGGSTVPPISVGSVSTNLPTYIPDSAGYGFGSSQLNSTRGGKVTALGVAPTGTAT